MASTASPPLAGRLPPIAEFTVSAPALGETLPGVRVGAGWAGAEGLRRPIWRWALRPDASLVLTNPAARPVEAQLGFSTYSFQERDLRVEVRGRPVWSGHLDGRNSLKAQTLAFALPPGDTVLNFTTPQPPAVYPADDPRPLTFMLTGLQLTAGPPVVPPAR